MITTFDELSKNIDLSKASSPNLEKLRSWCEETLGKDPHVEGSVEESFDFYKNLAKVYFEKVLPSVQKSKLTAPVAAFDNLSSLQYLVDLGFDVYLKSLNPRAEDLNTPINGNFLLYLAAARGKFNTVKTLLELGANPLEKNTKGPNILFITLMLPILHDEYMKSNKAAIYLRLSESFDDLLDLTSDAGDNILHIMSIYGYKTLVENLLTKTKTLAFKANNLSHYPIHAAVLNAKHDCAKLELAVDGVADLTDARGRNALHYAAQYSDREMVEICLQHCDINAIDKLGQTPLILATIAGNSEAIKALLDVGAKINSTDGAKRSALHYAVESNTVSAVKQLLEHPDIDVNISDDNSKTPLDLLGKDSVEISELFRAKRD